MFRDRTLQGLGDEACGKEANSRTSQVQEAPKKSVKKATVLTARVGAERVPDIFLSPRIRKSNDLRIHIKDDDDCISQEDQVLIPVQSNRL